MQRLIILIVVIGQNMVGSAAAMGSPEEPQNAGAAILGRVRVVPTHNSSAFDRRRRTTRNLDSGSPSPTSSRSTSKAAGRPC